MREMADKKELLTCEDVLNSIGYDEVLVRDESVDGFLIAFGYSGFRDVSTIHFRHYFTQEKARKTLVTLDLECDMTKLDCLTQSEERTISEVPITLKTQINNVLNSSSESDRFT